MKILSVLVGLIMTASLSVVAQDELTKAGEEACNCLKELDPATLSKTDLRLEMLGCMSNPVDGIAEALTKKNEWSDTLALKYLGLVGKEVRARCPEQLERLKKKEVVIDSALLKIKSGAELVPGYAEAACNCITATKDVDECLKQVGRFNEAVIKKHFPDDAFSAIMGLTMDVMYELADHCEAAASNETIAALKKFPAIKEGCSNLVLGEFITQSMFGETHSKFTATKLQEYMDGKLTAEYSLTWAGCVVTMKCTTSKSEMVKKGSETKMEIKRASGEGFIGSVTFGKMQVPVNYNKVK